MSNSLILFGRESGPVQTIDAKTGRELCPHKPLTSVPGTRPGRGLRACGILPTQPERLGRGDELSQTPQLLAVTPQERVIPVETEAGFKRAAKTRPRTQSTSLSVIQMCLGVPLCGTAARVWSRLSRAEHERPRRRPGRALAEPNAALRKPTLPDCKVTEYEIGSPTWQPQTCPDLFNSPGRKAR